MTASNVTLDDKYILEDGRVYLTGIQALVRLSLEQRRRDAALGLDTAGFVSGYRGSPLGGLDQTLWRARAHLEGDACPECGRPVEASQLWARPDASCD